MIRAFIAVDIPPPLKEKIDAQCGGMKKIDGAISWTKLENVHITLKFLGDIREDQVDPVAQGTTRASSGTNPFRVELTGFGIFPNERSPRVIWVGVGEGAKDLVALQAAIEREMAKVGFKKEGRPFSPHVTIGRVRSPRVRDALMETMRAASPLNDSFTVSRLVLMQSQLRPGGSVYIPLRTVDLGSPAR